MLIFVNTIFGVWLTGRLVDRMHSNDNILISLSLISNSEVLNLAERITLKTDGSSNDGDYNEASIVLTPFQMRLGHSIQIDSS